MRSKLATCLIVSSVFFGTASAVLADRPPNAEERSRIENVLRTQGFTRWDNIELDDELWEIDDAVAADGRKYDLKLNPSTLEIVERKLD